MRRKIYVVLITLIVLVVYQVCVLWSDCQGSCFNYVSYECQDCTTPRCSDFGCLVGVQYWQGDCCCMKPESQDRCCYYRCYAYRCLSYDPFYFHCNMSIFREVYRDYYAEFYPSECDTTGICVHANPVSPGPPGGVLSD